MLLCCHLMVQYQKRDEIRFCKCATTNSMIFGWSKLIVRRKILNINHHKMDNTAYAEITRSDLCITNGKCLHASALHAIS
jgi:hypothetical protein